MTAIRWNSGLSPLKHLVTIRRVKGLVSGTIVVTAGVHKLREGQTVRLKRVCQNEEFNGAFT